MTIGIRTVACPGCDGSGECGWCEGTGSEDGGVFDDVDPADDECPGCEGTGRCELCEGVGRVAPDVAESWERGRVST